MKTLVGLSICFCLTIAGCTTRAHPPAASALPEVELVSDGSYRMGTLLELTLASRDPRRARAAIGDAFSEVAELELLVSRYDSQSALSKLVANAGRGATPVESRLYELLGFAVEAHTRTRGAFDVTAAPLIELWKRAWNSGAEPTASAQRVARLRIGIGRIGLVDGKVELEAGTDLDLGGVAKGWALDQLAAELQSASESTGGAGAFLGSFGQSSILASGAPPGEPGWRLLLRSPDGGIAGELRLRDRAFSVSASHPPAEFAQGESAIADGRSRGHIIDPRTGTPLEEAIEAAVVARSCAEAEIWSTALLVLGREEGLGLIEAEPGIEALILDSRGAHASAGWQAATGFEAYESAPKER